ncbi:MAK10-like protein [Tanacetum coccineum]
MDSFQGLTPKSPSSWHRSLAPNPNFYDHVNPITRRTIDQAAGGKLRDKNDEESWALLEDLALYDNESWNDPRDFAKPVKAISMPQDVPMNKIASSCEICNGPYDTQYCMENPEQAFVEYASMRTDEAGGLMSNFMASKDAKISRFEGDFKQYQSEVTNKLDIFLKAFNDQMTGVLPSDTVKNPKLNTNLTSLGDSKPFDTLADLGSCVNLLPLKLFKELKVGLVEETDDIIGLADGTKSYPIRIVKTVEVHVGKLKLFKDFHVVDMEIEPTCPLLEGRGFLATTNAELDFGEDNVPYWTTIGKRESYKPQTSKDGIGRKAYLVEGKQIPSLGVFDEVLETPSENAQTTSGLKSDAVWKFLTSSGSAVKY